MPLALNGAEWAVLLVSIVPVILAVVIVYFVWRWAIRSEAAEAAERTDRHDA